VSLFDAIVLGLVQGLTEFLPVSSSGHLVIAGTILGVPTPGIFVEVALHVATLLAVLIVYRQRVANLVVGALRREAGAWRYIGLLILASVPAGIVGVFFADAVERAFNTPALTGIMLIVTGVILWSTKRLAGREAGGRGHDEATVASALGMGVAQAFAILPGISRSGSTIATGLWGRLSGEAAAEFSFLMSVIAISGAALLQAGEATGAVHDVGAVPLAVGFIVALVSGVLAIRFLLWLLRRQTFFAFAYYVWIVGGLFLLYLGVRP